MVNAPVTDPAPRPEGDLVTGSDPARTITAASVAPSASTWAVLKVVRLAGRLPFRLRSALGWGIGYLVGCLPTRERRIAQRQLTCFLKDPHPARIARRVFAHAGRTMLQSVNLSPVVSQHQATVTCRNWEQLYSLCTGSRPVIALTAHTGNWDLLAAYTIARGVPLTTIGREARSPLLHEVLKEIRGAYGVETIWRSDRAGVKRLIERLRQRRVVAALIDQDTRVESSFVPFFGTPAKTPSALIALGTRCNARFMTAFLFQTGPQHFEVFADEIPDGLESDAILAEYSARLEALIRRFPEQWVWLHKRWRTQPALGTLSSQQYLQWLAQQHAQPAAST